MCLYPRMIYNKKYTANKKNGGVIPAVSDERVKHVAIGCGNCMECLKKKAREWQVRLMEEVKENKNGKFVTLTFSDESIYKLSEGIKVGGYNLDNAIAKKAVRFFLERWRKKYKRSIRHWLVTELGHNGTENIHLHGILFTDEIEDIEKIWKYGHVWNGKLKDGRYKNYVNEKTVNYLIKYVYKMDSDHKTYKAKILTSPGIGAGYIKSYNAATNKYKGKKTDETYTTRTGHRISLPIYYRNKIYKEEEREKLWIEKLDKEERYVLKQRIGVKDEEGIKRYFRALEAARSKNMRLGYGQDAIDWELKKYEQELRNLKISERIAKGKKKNNNK